MGLDFWAVKVKEGITKEDFTHLVCWDLIENVNFHDLIEKDISDFILYQNDKDWYKFCKDTVGYFVGGDPIYINSTEDINTLSDKLNEFIEENPNYEYNRDGDRVFSNEDIRMFIEYINSVKDNGFVLWCSW